MFSRVATAIGRRLAHFLERERPGYTAFSVIPLDRLEAALRPGDVLLVEGNSRISSAIKYLTHSTWSHSAFYAGGDDPAAVLIEADLENGVQAVSLARHAHLNTRICRPVGLADADCRKVIAHMRRSIGRSYDLRNVFDLMRYLLPNPPVPQRWRRRMLELGSGDPTRAICSTLIAEAFQSVRYPILPELAEGASRKMREEVLRIRHHSLFTPRDFDLSPYFRIVKPTIEEGFDYRGLLWEDHKGTSPAASPSPPPSGQKAGKRLQNSRKTGPHGLSG